MLFVRKAIILFLFSVNYLLAGQFAGMDDNLSNNKNNNNNNSVNNNVSLFSIHNDNNPPKPAPEIEPYFNPDMANEKTQKGYKYAEKGMHEIAIEFYLEALVADQQNASTYHALGYSKSHLGDYKGAQKAYMKALTMNDSDERTLAHLGHNYEKMGNDNSAMLFYSRALEKNPNNKFTLYRFSYLIKNLDSLETSQTNYYISAKPSLKIRKFPFYGSEVVANLKTRTPVKLIREFGDEIIISSKQGKWALIKYNGKYGFAFTPYLSISNKNNAQTPNENIQKIAKEGGSYTVQLASHTSAKNAKKSLDKFSTIRAFAFKDKTNERTIVAVGRFLNSKEAKKYIQTLKIKMNMKSVDFFPKKIDF